MKMFKVFVSFVALTVLFICIYCFLVGNDVFDGNFDNEPFAWYFLAKGIFCSLALYLLVLILEAIKKPT